MRRGKQYGRRVKRTGETRAVLHGKNKDAESLCQLTHINVLSIDPAIKHFATRFGQRSWNSIITFSMYLNNFESEDVFLRITEHFERLDRTIADCHVAIVEGQYHENHDMIRVAQHIITYLTITYPNLIVVEISPQAKYQALDMPTGLTPYQRKKWSVEKCRELAEERRDYLCIDALNTCPFKLDDIAETVTQEEAWFKVSGILPRYSHSGVIN